MLYFSATIRISIHSRLPSIYNRRNILPSQRLLHIVSEGLSASECPMGPRDLEHVVASLTSKCLPDAVTTSRPSPSPDQRSELTWVSNPLEYNHSEAVNIPKGSVFDSYKRTNQNPYSNFDADKPTSTDG